LFLLPLLRILPDPGRKAIALSSTMPSGFF
jgi:hypothetical protein